MDSDLAIRLETFRWLAEATAIQGEVLPRDLLARGFRFEGERIPLMSPQGIFKPRALELPLTITSSPKGPYEDSLTADGVLLYRYRGTDPFHRDNVGLRRVFERQLPLAYFYGIVPGRYLALWPVYVIGDDRRSLAFRVVLDDPAAVQAEAASVDRIGEEALGRRMYVTSTVRARLHQQSFREKVLYAYRSQCALCRLRHRELLDAAHIIPDSELHSSVAVNNGLALCKLHHAAFDRFMIGVTPDYIVHVREDILDEEDGPMLQHGLQELHQQRLYLPSSRNNWPDRTALEWRYESFRTAQFGGIAP